MPTFNLEQLLNTPFSLVFVIGVGLIGLVLGWLIARLGSARRIATLEAMLEYEVKSAEERLQGMDEHFSALSTEALQDNNQRFVDLAQQVLQRFYTQADQGLKGREVAVSNLVKPLQEALNRTHEQLHAFDKQQRSAQGELVGQMQAMTTAQATLHKETRNLATALRRPEVRGQWGELTLKRLVELAGMTEHADFNTQVSIRSETGLLRPDMLIKLPTNRQLVIDVKTPLDAYLSAIESENDADKLAHLQQHAKQVQSHVSQLSQKQYWAQFEQSPEFVVLFIPGDQFLSAALEQKPNLLENAFKKNIVIATPTSLVALLRVIAHGWREHQLDTETQAVRALAKEFDHRLRVFSGHLNDMGKNLEGALSTYNRAINSYQSRLLPTSKRFAKFGSESKAETDTKAPLGQEIDGQAIQVNVPNK